MRKRFTAVMILLGLIALIGFTAAQPARAGLNYVGVDYPWVGYGSGFGSSYNSSTADSYLNEIRYTYHCNLVRIWCCEGLDGLSFNSSGACTGLSSTNISHIEDFVGRANGKGITCDCVFINFLDVQNHSNMISNQSNANALVWNGFIPLAKALNGKSAWFDLINEGNLATNVVSWSSLRWFCNTAVNAEHNQGVYNWVTMSDQNSSDYTNYFYSTVGGLGFSFYDYHAYGDSGSLAVSPSNVGGAPLLLGEYGPGSPWMDRSDSANQTTINNIMNNASNMGYQGAVAWCYLPDGSNWQLRGNNAMWVIEWWAADFGH
ncbi:MAG TPA: hypothetical protein VKX96_06345 [Chloroflexota bacterium]|nr:hypothetical protein [Chloroflexota bacterium]